MNRFVFSVLTCVLCAVVPAVTQSQVLTMDDEPHYSRIFSNEYCRAYVVNLGRLAETKPVVHEHDWVRMTLGGAVEQAWNGTVFGRAPYEDPDGYVVSFLYPVSRVTIRNPRNEPYSALIVEIMQEDDSRNQWRDPSFNPLSQTLGSGVDSHASYVTTLTKTSVEIMNVQLVGGDAKEFGPMGRGGLLVAMTDLNMSYSEGNGATKDLQLSKGEVKWLSVGRRTFKNLAAQPARFVLLEMR